MRAVLAWFAACVAVGPLLAAQDRTPEAVLAERWPRATIVRREIPLGEAELAAIETRAGTRPERAVCFRYDVRIDGAVVARGYTEVHRVRTLREALFVVVGADGRIAAVDVLAFAEPRTFAPRARFLAQFVGRRLDDDLQSGRGIDGMTGATLTTRAVVGGARRALATDAVITARDGSHPPDPVPPPSREPVERGTEIRKPESNRGRGTAR
ncbi:MAG: FMN-binding protein [Planctomycetes bacterium]|nr:FMN-binding protein [Planctomycetota bacterium]